MKNYLLVGIGFCLSPCLARVPSQSEEALICAFIFSTAFLFSFIPAGIMVAFKKHAAYNIALGILLSSIIFYLASQANISLIYCTKLTIALLSGWIISHLLAHIYIFKPYSKNL